MNKHRIFGSGLLALILALFITVIVLFLVYVKTLFVYIICICVIYLIDVTFSIWVFNTNRQTLIKLCWIFWINALPLIGCLIFVVFGTQPFTSKNLHTVNDSWSEFTKLEDYTYTRELLANNQLPSIYHYNLSAGLSPVYQHNEINIIPHLVDLYDTSINLIRSAKKSIYIITYILDDGFWLRTIAAELVKKVQAGVKVYLLYDWLGCYFKKPHHLLKQLTEHGVNVAIFNPHGINMFKGSTNYRNHQKALIIDNMTAIYGGSNIGDEYLTISSKTNYWNDLNFLVSGEIVNSLSIGFIHNWLNLSSYTDSKKPKYQAVNQELEQYAKNHIKPQAIATKNCDMQLIHSSADYEPKQVEQSINLLFNQAQSSIKVVTPYFVPSETILNSLCNTALRGIKVTLIFPRLNDDKSMVVPTNRSYYAKLKRAGCHIYEYNGFIHAKYMIIDDLITFAGSNNLDFRSLWINFENALIIQNKAFAKQMNEIFNRDMDGCTAISDDDISKFTTRKARYKRDVMNFFLPLI